MIDQKDLFLRWLDHPITGDLMKWADDNIELINNKLASKQVALGDLELRCELVGRRETFEQLKSISLIDIEEVENEDKGNRSVSSTKAF